MAVQQAHESIDGIPPQTILQVALVCLGQSSLEIMFAQKLWIADFKETWQNSMCGHIKFQSAKSMPGQENSPSPSWPPPNAAGGKLFRDIHFRIRQAADLLRPLCFCGEVAEVHLLPCLVCPSQPPPSSVGRSSSWAHEGVDPAGLQCRHSSPPHALAVHWPTGKTDPEWFKTKPNVIQKSCTEFLIREGNNWPVSAYLCCPEAASLCACKHGLSAT